MIFLDVPDSSNNFLDVVFIVDLHDEPPEYFVGFPLRVILDIVDSQNIHDIVEVVLFETVDAEHGVDLGGQFIHIDVLVESDQSDEGRAIQWYIFQGMHHCGFYRLYLFLQCAQVDHEEQASIAVSGQGIVGGLVLGGTLLMGRVNIGRLVVDLELECSVLRHQLIGQLLRRYRLGIVSRQGRHSVAEAATDVLQVVVNGTMLVHDGLARASEGRVLELDAVAVLEGRVMEGWVDDRTSLLHLGGGSGVPDELDGV